MIDELIHAVSRDAGLTPEQAAAAGSAGVGSATPAGGDGGGDTRIIILGDDYGSLSAREREARIRETMRGAGVSIEGDFTVNG